MDTTSGTVTIWHCGRLAPSLATRGLRLRLDREAWLGAGLLILCAVVLAVFVGVLESDVERNALGHAAQRSRAVAQAQCEDAQPADRRGRCRVLFTGHTVAAAAIPVAVQGPAAYEQDNAARATSVSLAALR